MRGFAPGGSRLRTAGRAGLAAAVLCLALADAAVADDVHLKDNTVVSGRVENERCAACTGTGRVPCPECKGKGRAPASDDACKACGAAGSATCAACGGLGVGAAKIRVRTGRGIVIELDRGDVTRIVWKPVDEAVLSGAAVAYAKRSAALKVDSAEEQFALGTWCVENGLTAEARRHLTAAARLDETKYASRVKPFLDRLSREQEAKAVKAMLGAFGACDREGPEAGAAAIRAVYEAYPDTQIVLRKELQRDIVKQHFPRLAAAGLDCADRVLQQADDRAALRCPDCDGSGKLPCPACRGTGTGPCPECAGTGRRACTVCAGTARLTCPQCYGRGRTTKNIIGYGERECPDCAGKGETPCDVCAETGRLQCRACAGSGRVNAKCAGCAGDGKVACSTCGGSGVRRVAEFRWAAPQLHQAGVVDISGPGARHEAWQGVASGGVITVMPETVLWRGALAENLSAAGCKGIQLVAVSMDNRKGTKLLRFNSADRNLRLVNAEAAQAENVDLAGMIRQADANSSAGAAAKAADSADCLPGAYVCLVAAFRDPPGIASAVSFFWVQEGIEPVKLDKIWLSADEVAALRSSLAKP